MSRQLKTPKKPKVYDPRQLSRVPDEAAASLGVSFAFVDRANGWAVQVWEKATAGCNGTPWEGTLRVAVKHSLGRTPETFTGRKHSVPITWDDLQAIKDHFWPDRIAIEIYPPKEKIVDIADLRWLWVLPVGAILPFNLDASSQHELRS